MSRDDELYILALLEALVLERADPAVAAKERQRQLAASGLQGLQERIRFLIGRLGFRDLNPSRLIQTWLRLLGAEPGATRGELLAAAHRLSRSIEQDEGRLGPWKRAFLARLEPTLATRDTVDSSGDGERREVPEDTLDLAPLLHDWPSRLLNHPSWALAESPLPDLEPLHLDDVWVDLQLVRPEHFTRVGERYRVREALDQRYEERSWRAQPLEFTMERFEGSAVLVGPPGSGKTTLLKWIARWLVRHPGGRFILPLWIPLRGYGYWRAGQPKGNLLDYGLIQAGVQEPQQRELWANVLSYLAGPYREHVLLLLDGWDEVRASDRATVRQDIDNHTHGFAVLMTSRPSGRPRQLPIYDLFEIVELSRESIQDLIQGWFSRAGEPRLADELREQLALSPDLQRLARNPFLLTLLCGLFWHHHEEGRERLPKARTALYESAIQFILQHHDQRYPEQRFTLQASRDVERFALWLLDGAPGAPRFIFSREDVEACCGQIELFDKYLEPSRLLSQLGMRDEFRHFLHATFQEFLAAKALSRLSGVELVSLVRQRSRDVAWLEVLQFLSGLSGTAHALFWQELAHLAEEPDRFGHVFLRLARFAAEARLPNGGLEVLGIDLRSQLWKGVQKSTTTGRFVDALHGLDSSYLVNRLRAAIQGDDETLKQRALRNLSRVPEPEISQMVVDVVLAPHAIHSQHVLEQLHETGRLHPRSLTRLQQICFSESAEPDIRRRALRALGDLRTDAAIPEMVSWARRHPGEARDVQYALGWMGGTAASRALIEMLDWRMDLDWQVPIIQALGLTATALARDHLLQRLALLPPGEPSVVPILEALHGLPIHVGASFVLFLLQDDVATEVRVAAAHALQEATGTGIVSALARAAGGDQAPEVRLAALESLNGRGQPNEVSWLKSRIEDVGRSAEERAAALRVLLTTAQRFAQSRDGRWLEARAAAAVLLALEEPVMDPFVKVAVELAHLAGKTVAPRLIEVAVDSEVDWNLRCMACASLGRLRSKMAVGSLIELVRQGPESRRRDRMNGLFGPWAEDPTMRWEVVGGKTVLPQQTFVLTTPEHSVGQAAADALAWIDPGVLLDLPGTSVSNALSTWALETGALVFRDRIVGADGMVIAHSSLALGLDEWASGGGPVRVPDLKLFIRVEESGREPQLWFELESKDPSLGLTRDRFGPVTLGRSAQDFQRDLIEEIEHAGGGPAAYQAIHLHRLQAKGLQLFELLPRGLRTWLWTLRRRVRSIQVVSDEMFLPWELLWLPDPQGTSRDQGAFAVERFALSRWRQDVPERLHFGLQRVALVAPEATSDEAVQQEIQDLMELLGEERLVLIEPRHRNVLDALGSGEFDGWHFVGHARSARGGDADLWELRLEGDQTLRPEDLRRLGAFGRRRPWIFLNGCSTGLVGPTLRGAGGWAMTCLEEGAGAFIGSSWKLPSQHARHFARSFYGQFLAGKPFAEVARESRQVLRSQFPGSSSSFAYTVYGHPLATFSGVDSKPDRT